MLPASFAIVLFSLAGLQAQGDLVPLPPAGSRVSDAAQVLDIAAKQRLHEISASLEQRKGSQLAFVIVNTTGPESIEAYTLRVAEAWRIGRAGVDDGVIVLAAIRDRRLRIEVGYGLEGAVPDAIAKRIITEEIVPRFRAGDYGGGLEAGAQALIARIDPEALPPPGWKERADAWMLEHRRSVDDYYMPFVFIAMLAAGIFGLARRRFVRGLLAPALAIGIVGGLIAIFLHAEHLLVAAGFLVPYGLLYSVFYAAIHNSEGGAGSSAYSGSSSSGYSSSGYSGSSGGSSFSSGSSGSWSGGGGSFGGGGASGSW